MTPQYFSSKMGIDLFKRVNTRLFCLKKATTKSYFLLLFFYNILIFIV